MQVNFIMYFSEISILVMQVNFIMYFSEIIILRQKYDTILPGLRVLYAIMPGHNEGICATQNAYVFQIFAQ